MKLIILGSILLVILAACAAPDPTVTPAATSTPPPVKSSSTSSSTGSRAETLSRGEARTQEDIIDLSPSVTDSSIHAEVGDRVEVQVDISSFRDSCQNLKVRDPFGNVVAELAPKKIRNGDVEFLQFRGAFLAATDGDYLVELRPDSGNLSCGGVRVFAASAKVKWTVQPN